MTSLRTRPHRAWAVCLGCSIALFTVMGLGVNVFTIYQPWIIQVYGFTNAQGSWITTVRSLFSLLAMFTVGVLCRRLGLRYTMTLGVACFAASYALFGAAHTFPAYCAAAALSGLAYAYGGMIPLTLVISNWFQRRRGLALGLAAAGSGLPTIFFPPLLTQIIPCTARRSLEYCSPWLFSCWYAATPPRWDSPPTAPGRRTNRPLPVPPPQGCAPSTGGQWR